MQQDEKITPKPHVNYFKKVGKVVLRIILFLFLFVLIVFLLVLTPPVQRFLTGKVQHYLENKLKTKVEIGSISFGLSGNINLKNIYIEDKTKDTLISGGAIKAHVNLLKLFSNEVQVKDIELQNITTKIKRVLPDTAFNFQFIADAFMSEKSKSPDTAKSAPLKLDISDVALDNVNLSFKDVITGNDVFAHIGMLSATIDSLDPYLPRVAIPTLIVRNVQAHMYQNKPLVEPKPMAVDMAKASAPISMKLSFGTVDLNKIALDYKNDVSALYSNFNIGRLKVDGKLLDLQHQKIYLDQIALSNSKFAVRLGKTPRAAATAKEVNQKVQAQTSQPWDFRIAHLRVDDNTVLFDNDNTPRQAYGLDPGHIKGDSLTLYADNIIFKPDSMGAVITKGKLREKSGLMLQDVRGDLLYAYNQTYLRNLYIKTPGTVIQKNATLQYASLDALSKDFAKTVFNIELTNSHVQVRDILVFVPQLRANPAFRNPNDVWNLNIVGHGTMNHLTFETLQFDGLRNTQLSAKGTLAGLTNPTSASGNFTIYRFHTTQNDIAALTGQRLSNAQMTFPEAFDINGTINGNAGRLNTNLNIATSLGFIGINGVFTNIMKPNALAYNATIRTSNLQLGTILKQPDQMGSLTATISANGHGSTPQTINTTFRGNIASFGYNHYQYHGIAMSGWLRGTTFSATTVSRDPNLSLNLTASGNFSSNPSFQINGMIDSVKTLPLHFTTQQLIFRGKVNGTVANITKDNIDANVLITNSLFVSGTTRLTMDTVQLASGRNDTAQYIRFRSDILNALVTGHYSISDFGTIFQNAVAPYFASSTATPAQTAKVQPYDIRFRLDAVYNPILSTFVSGLTAMQPIHAEGRLATNQGLQAVVTAPYIMYSGNELTNATIHVGTSDSLRASVVVAHLKSGSSFDVYNARINVAALQNNISFSLGIDDKNARNKYFLSGLFTQPANGTYAVKLYPGNLLLNYQRWTVSPDNQIIISPTNIVANDFVLQQAAQQLKIFSSPGSAPQPLNVSFNNFRLATITGFIKSDSLLADGTINGTVTFHDLLKHPLFAGDLTIANLTMRQDTIGNVHAIVSNTSANVYNANITVTGNGNDVQLTGTASPQAGGVVAFDLNLAIRALQLRSIQGALQSAITNASGAITGNVHVTGNTNQPNINGQLSFDNASFAIAMLGSQWRLNHETLTVNNEGIQFNHFTIRDSLNNALVIDGAVSTTNFVNYGFNLDVTADNFRVLNSTKRQNNIYYGLLIVSTRLRITGTETKPVVDGSLTIADSTNLTVVVPQSQPGVESRDGIVQFVDFSANGADSLFKAPYDSLKKTNNVLGLTLTVNIIIRKGATMNLIIDEANGDFVNIKGHGQLSAGIDPSGNTALTGTYSIDEGSYQVSYNLLKRSFTIQSGSSITWMGDPTTAELNITAVYIANTPPLDLVQDQLSPSANKNTYLQKLPFHVDLMLTGMLMQPKINFDILLPPNQNYGVSSSIINDVNTALAQIRQDPNEINKQVFALLLLGRFIGQDPFQSSGGGGGINSMVAQSVSKLLTQQLNSLASGLINGVDLNFDVVSTDDYTTGELRNRTDLNVGLSKRLLNNRLTVSVGSNFELQGPHQNNQQSSNIAGNISLDYQLSKSGRYMLRLYRKNNYEEDLEGYVIETGVGFIISMDYNRFADILRKRKARDTAEKAAPKISNQ